MLAGEVPFAKIQAYKHFLLAPFPGSTQLCPLLGWTRLLAHGVPFTENDMILTPFSLSPTTDTAVDCLPALFLAYCTLADSDDALSIDDRVTPRPSVINPIPLLTDCAFGLGPSFLSCSR
jgi:hypothetical protein